MRPNDLLLRLARWLVRSMLALPWCLPGAAAASGPDRPDPSPALWGSDVWGVLKVAPRMARYGDTVFLHGLVVGGPASDPWWSCSQYEAWVANGTSEIGVVVPGDWGMVGTGHDIFGNLVHVATRDGGEEPPYGWDARVSDTCYCVVDTFGASGGCESREVRPVMFRMMDLFNPREGNVQRATVTSRSGWVPLEARFSGRAGVGWSAGAVDYVYVLTDEGALTEDLDGDGISDAWEYAHSPNKSLDDFGAPPVGKRLAPLDAEPPRWVSPYAPGEPGWVVATPGDWDGDGFSDADEYRRWLDRGVDGAGVPFDPTVINTRPAAGGSGCASGHARPDASPLIALLIAAVAFTLARTSRRTPRPR